MKTNYKYCIIGLLFTILAIWPQKGSGQVLSDYTAFPPFVTNAVAPNILLVLDHSGSMQFPAYTGCTFYGYSSSRADCGSSTTAQNPEYAYDTTKDYYGYFKTDKYYQYASNKFVENAACSFISSDPGYMIGNSSGCISGNLLNWISMSRIDLLRKALVGGKSVSTQTNAHTLRSEGGWRQFTDYGLGCTFKIDGGSYPQLDHRITISNSGVTGTCGNLTVWGAGSSVWDSKDGFRYVYQSVSGNFDASLRVVHPPSESGQTFAKGGLMVRTSTSASSQNVKAMATYGSGLQFSVRYSSGGGTSLIGNYVAIAYPVWVRIVRSGNTFTYYYSSDGTAWILHDSVTVAMPSTVLIGMATSSYAKGILGSAEYDEFICSACSDDDFNDGFFNTSIWSGLDINTTIDGNQLESCSGACAVGTLTSSNLNVDVPNNEKSGVIQAVSDKDNDGNFDANAPRFGLMAYASDNRYGCMRVGVEGSNMSSLVNALQNEVPYYGTPTGEALNEAYDYFKQVNNNSGCNNNAYIGGPGSNKDPWYDSSGPVACRKSFVLLISDGEWNGSVDPVIPARETHVNDVRPDIDGKQTLKHFTVYTFGDTDAGINSMQQIAMYGGFEDYDDNTWPYNRTGYPADSRTPVLPAAPCTPSSTDANCKEWDDNLDGIPDTYYEASKGNELEASLVTAISDILKQASSGTAVSVLATTGEGEGSIYQAYFFPEKLEGLESRKWLGFIHALFVDKYGNLREDTNGNDTLDLTSDYIIEMEYSPDDGTRVKKFRDADGDGEKDSLTPSTTGSLENIESIWNGGEILWDTNPADRNILTTTDGFSEIAFDMTNSMTLAPYLRAADTLESDNIINWTRGDDLTGMTDTGHPDGYRPRDLTINGANKVWKLGDVIYSTPTVVAKPMENYDLLYGDSSYTSFRYTHKQRRQTVYVGANDGMLHAFNAGCFDQYIHKYFSDVDSSGNCTSGSHILGQELWAFIPRGLLPHLKWNTLPDYTHVYHVDLKPKVTDVKIFTASSIHTNGWGTILIGGFRYGGKDITWSSGGTSYSASPEYFALDVTDPLNPRLLWTFSDPDLGLSMSYPAVAKIGDEWYAIFGSGATDYNSGSDLLSFQAGNVFVLKLSAGTNGVIDTWTLNSNYWKLPTGNTTSFMASPVTVDVDLDYDSDVVYIGENSLQGSKWNGLLRRITTSEGTLTAPSSWSLSTIADVSSISGTKDVIKKITSAPSAAMDDRSNLWVFFGTGQFYGMSDKNQTDTGAFYAVKDGCWTGSCATSYTSLLDISNASVNTDGSVSGISGSCGGGASTWGNLLTASYSCDGWAMYFGYLGESVDFTGETLMHNGERMLSKPLVLGGLVTWATYIPGIDECSFEGESNVYAVYYKTGTAFKKYIFTEQLEDNNPSSTVARVKRLGVGMPSSVSAQITSSGTTKGFVQSQNGSILQLETQSPLSLSSGLKGWMSERVQ